MSLTMMVSFFDMLVIIMTIALILTGTVTLASHPSNARNIIGTHCELFYTYFILST